MNAAQNLCLLLITTEERVFSVPGVFVAVLHTVQYYGQQHRCCTLKNQLSQLLQHNLQPVSGNIQSFYILEMSSQTPPCHFNVLLCVSNNTWLSEHSIRPFSKSLEPTCKWHHLGNSFCFNKMSTLNIYLHISSSSPSTSRVLL